MASAYRIAGPFSVTLALLRRYLAKFVVNSANWGWITARLLEGDHLKTCDNSDGLLFDRSPIDRSGTASVVPKTFDPSLAVGRLEPVKNCVKKTSKFKKDLI